MPGADTVLFNGAVWAGPGTPLGPDRPTAVAIRGGRISALGLDAVVREHAGSECDVIDLGGRRVIPGLIDGHIHAVRAGPTWDRELNWTGVPDVPSALATIADVTSNLKPGEWLSAVGGWHPSQFTERRAPSREELDAVAGDSPVYLQALYEFAVLNSAGLRRSGIAELSGDPPGGAVERDGDGRPTGRVTGLGAYSLCLNAMPHRTPDEECASTAAMMRDLHAVGLTGLVDAAGFAMDPRRYDALYRLWRLGELTMRLRLFVSAVDAGREIDQLGGWLTYAQNGFGDDMLRMLGIGEVVHFGCHDFEGLEPFSVSDRAAAELETISRETARRGWPMQVHAVLDATIDRVLDAWERVDAEVALRDLRFTIAHADCISRRNIARLGALGGGVVLDDHQVFKAHASRVAWGDDQIRRAPPIGDLVAAGVPIAAGTDATRASSVSPWLALWWLVTGRSVDGESNRAPEHRLSRDQALTAYTGGSAWMSFEERDRGHLRSGAHADLAVLDRDYFSIAEDDIRHITAELTMVGGRIVHSSGVLAAAGPGNSGPAPGPATR